MKNYIMLMILLLLFFAENAVQGQEISQQLQERLSSELNRSSNEFIPIIIKFDKDLDKTNYRMNMQQRTKQVILDLQENAQHSQEALIEELNAGVRKGEVKDFKSHWIANVISANVKASFVKNIKARSNIELLDVDSEIKPLDFDPADSVNWATNIGGVYRYPPTYNLRLINADKLWNLGITGQGRLAMTVDDGVDITHPALSHNYRGNHVPHQQAWFDVTNTDTLPSYGNHGTETMGTICGIDTLTHDTVGVAFDSEWIASNAMIANSSAILNSYEWAMNPDSNLLTTDDVPDVINNSWKFVFGITCNSVYKTAFENLATAGIAVVFAAGNDGYGPGYTRGGIPSPADVVVSLVNPFTVGAIDVGIMGRWDPIAFFSSRGPTECTGYTGSLDIKPEVCAPGSGVWTSKRGGGYENGLGTSIAAPHVSGAILLLKQAFPALSTETIMLALYNTAIDLWQAGEDNSYGMGMIDVYAAYQYLNMSCDNDIAIRGPIFYKQNISVNDAITANSDVIQSANVTFTAGSSITFKHGFHANKGCRLTASIGECTPPAGNSIEVLNQQNQLNAENSTSIVSNVKEIEDSSIKMYPSLADDQVTIENTISSSPSYSVMIIDSYGKMIFYKDDVHQTKIEIPVSDWASGIYFARIQQGKSARTFKLIKN
jgi:hypothetical protein